MTNLQYVAFDPIFPPEIIAQAYNSKELKKHVKDYDKYTVLNPGDELEIYSLVLIGKVVKQENGKLKRTRV